MPQQRVWILLLAVGRLSGMETYALTELCRSETAIGELRQLAQEFLYLFRIGHAESLDDWFREVGESMLQNLQTFALSPARAERADCGYLTTLEQWTN